MSVRVYVGVTRDDLSRLAADGVLLPEGRDRRGHAVTPALEDAWPEAGAEELEHAVLMAAAADVLSAEPTSPDASGRGPGAVLLGRAVVVAEVADGSVRREGLSEVVLSGPVHRHDVHAIHADAVPAQARTGRLLLAARDGDAAAADALDDVDLGWFGTQELEELLSRVG